MSSSFITSSETKTITPFYLITFDLTASLKYIIIFIKNACQLHLFPFRFKYNFNNISICLLTQKRQLTQKKQLLDEKLVSLLFCLVFLLCMRLVRKCLGQGSFLGILALWWTFTCSIKKKGPTRKKYLVFSPGNS